MQCPNCGANVNPGARFCTTCAAPMSAGLGGPAYGGPGYGGQGYAPAPAPGKSSAMPIIITVVVLVVLIGGGVAAYFLLAKKPADTSTASTKTTANDNSAPPTTGSDRGGSTDGSGGNSGGDYGSAMVATPGDVTRHFFRAMEMGDADALKQMIAPLEQRRVSSLVGQRTPDIKRRGGIDSIIVSNERASGDDANVEFEIRFLDGSRESGQIDFIKLDDEWKVINMNARSDSREDEPPISAPTPGPSPAPPPPSTVPPPPPVENRTGSNPSVVRKSGGVLAGEAVRRVDPSYPPLAKAAHVEGTVIVEVTIDEQGNVTSARALSGHPLLKDAAVSAARGWRYKPTFLGGVPVKVVGTLTFNFNL